MIDASTERSIMRKETKLPINTGIGRSKEGIEIWNRSWETVKDRLFGEDPQSINSLNIKERLRHKKIWKDKYQYWYFPPGKKFSTDPEKMHTEIKTFAKPIIGLYEMFDREGRVLDLGCGGGKEVIGLAKQFKKIKIEAIDYELGEAIPFPQHVPKNLNFHKMDWRKMEFPDNSFDIIFSDQGIALYGKNAEIVKEMTRVAKVGAIGRFSEKRGFFGNPSFYDLLAEQGWEVFLVRSPSGENSYISAARLINK